MVKIYVVLNKNNIVTVTTLPRIVMDVIVVGDDTVQLWEKEKLTRTFTSLKEFSRFINPRPSEDDETGGNDYEW